MSEERPDDLAPLGGAMRAEWQAEEEELTRAAYDQWRHGRSFADLLAECATRGDTVHVTAATATFRGPVVDVGVDRFTIAAGPGPVDIALGADVVIGIDSAAAAEAGERPAAGGTLRARLLEHETSGATVLIGTSDAELRGVITVGADHVVVAHGELARAVAISSIIWIRLAEGGA